MMVLLKDLHGNEYHLNIDLIESILERQGNTSEIVLINGKRYSCIESPRYVSNKINLTKIANQPGNIQST
jgi:uncharacterized protein YlzI (FlbEa/FlbD family)